MFEFNKEKNTITRYTPEREIAIPMGVTKIGEAAFKGCTFAEKIIIPNGITSIGNYAFANCTSLKEIVLPEGVISLYR